ncbi:MAG TPA: ABC transporter permease subunit [Thermomicrobiales bacterium]|nr:ABC transporter permease subunit [Thermomicrobiales bacterium]
MATQATTLNRAPTREYSPVGFGATLASEWTKMFSTRSTYVMLGLALVLSFAMTALLSLAIGTTWDDASAATRADFEPITFSLVGLTFGGIVMAIFGVNMVSGEYSSGMIRTTLTATPKRGRVLAAKIVLIGAVAMLMSLVTTVGALAIGKAVLGSYDIPTFSMGDSDVLRVIIASTLTAPLFPLIGATFAFLFRSTATPITLVLALIFLPAMFGALFPDWWQENILSLLPGSAADSVMMGHLSDSRMYLDLLPAAIVVVVWLVITVGAAYVTLTRRDA